MGYPKHMDEYSEQDLIDELTRRATIQAAGKCDYCGRDRTTNSCKFVERHKVKEPSVFSGFFLKVAKMNGS